MVILQLDEQPPLIQAVFAGELDTVRKLLESKQDVNYQDFEKRSALHASAYRGDAAITELLIEHGARVNTKDCRWLTPLHRACCSGSEETVCVLLKNQADPSARDRLWQTPLHVASAYNSFECVQHLLDHIENPNVTDRSGRTALHHAVLNGHNDVVELLISKGCIVNACDKKDCRPIHWAAHKGHIETTEILLQNGADINAKDRNLYTPLHVAAASGSVGVIQTLLTHGACIDLQNAYGNTALHIACLNGHGSCAQELIRHRADTEACNYRGQTPLHIAAASTHGVHCLNTLVSLGVDINKQSCDGRTALHMTAIHGRFTRSKTLIDNGAIVDTVDKNGCTALHIAAQYGHELLSSTLLAYGANASKKGYEGRTPLHMCCLSGYIECCRVFIKAGVDLNSQDDLGKTPLHCAAYKGAAECVDLLVSSGADIKALDNLGRIPLHYAASQGHFYCIFTLAGNGSDPNAQDNEGCTALHLASAYDIDGKCVSYLLEHKADPKMRDFKGFTVVHYAVAGNNINALKFLLVALGAVALYGPDMPPTTPLHIAAKNGNMEILEALMPYFPDPNIRNEDGCTPLLLAARQGYANCVQMLLRFGAKVSICDSVAGLSPVHHSAKNGYVHCLALLVDNAEDKSIIDRPDNLHRTALMLAISNLHIDCVTTLIKSGADPNVLDNDGHSCLVRAVVTGQHSVLHMLLPRSTVVNTPDSNGKTILHVSAAYGKLACTQRILPFMEPTVAKAFDNQNFTALQWACYTGNFECVAHFFKEGVFDRLEGNPFSAIHCAASSGSERCIDLLCKQFGPETVRYKDTKCRTPLHIVAIHGHSDCALYLLDNGAEINGKDEDGRTPLMVAAMNGQLQVMEILLGYKADKTLYDNNGNTALHLACLRKHNHAALLLVDDSNVVNMINNERRTPLHISARNGLVDVTRQLIVKGSSVLAVDSAGLTPALSCAPNPSVAQCLAIILASHPIHIQGANCKDILNELETLRSSIKSLIPRPKHGKRRRLQTDITMVHNPDKFELEHMFNLKFDKSENVESEFKDWIGNVYVKFDNKEVEQSGPPKKKYKTCNYRFGEISYSSHDLHGSKSDMSLALKTIYSEEDYRKLIKKSVESFKKKEETKVKREKVMCSFRYDEDHRFDTDNHFNRDSRVNNRFDNQFDNQFDNRFDNRFDKRFDNHFDNQYDKRFDNQYDNQFDKDIQFDKNQFDKEEIVDEVIINPNRLPKPTNKKLKFQKIKSDEFKDHFDRCSICKKIHDDLQQGRIYEPNVSIEIMKDGINKVLTKKGLSKNKCLVAFLNESYEITTENAYILFHGMISPKCEPFISTLLNLKEGEVETNSDNLDKLKYFISRNQKKFSSTRIGKIKSNRVKNEEKNKSEPNLNKKKIFNDKSNVVKSISFVDKLKKEFVLPKMMISTFIDGNKVDLCGEILSSSEENKSFQGNQSFDGNKSFGENKSYGENKSFDANKSFDENESFKENNSFEKNKSLLEDEIFKIEDEELLIQSEKRFFTLSCFHSQPLFVNQDVNYFRCYPTYWFVPKIKNNGNNDDDEENRNDDDNRNNNEDCNKLIKKNKNNISDNSDNISNNSDNSDNTDTILYILDKNSDKKLDNICNKISHEFSDNISNKKSGHISDTLDKKIDNICYKKSDEFSDNISDKRLDENLEMISDNISNKKSGHMSDNSDKKLDNICNKKSDEFSNNISDKKICNVIDRRLDKNLDIVSDNISNEKSNYISDYSDNKLDNISDKRFDKNPDKLSGNVLIKKSNISIKKSNIISDSISDNFSDNNSDSISDTKSNKISNISDKKSNKVVNNISYRNSNTISDNIFDSFSNNNLNSISDKKPNKILNISDNKSNKIENNISDKNSNSISDNVLDSFLVNSSNSVSDKKSNIISDNVLDTFSENNSDKIPIKTSNNTSDKISNNILNNISDKLSNNISEIKSDSISDNNSNKKIPKDETIIYFNEHIKTVINEIKNEDEDVEEDVEDVEEIEIIGRKLDEKNFERNVQKVNGNDFQTMSKCDLRRKGGLLDMKNYPKSDEEVWAHFAEDFLKEKIQEVTEEEENVSSGSKKRKLTINIPRIQISEDFQEGENVNLRSFEKIEGNNSDEDEKLINKNENENPHTSNFNKDENEESKALILYEIQENKNYDLEFSPQTINLTYNNVSSEILYRDPVKYDSSRNKSKLEIDNDDYYSSSVIKMDETEKIDLLKTNESSDISLDDFGEIFECKTEQSEVRLEPLDEVFSDNKLISDNRLISDNKFISNKLISDNPIQNIYENFITQPSSSHASFQVDSICTNLISDNLFSENLTSENVVSESSKETEIEKSFDQDDNKTLSSSRSLPLSKIQKDRNDLKRKGKNYANIYENKGSKISVDSQKADYKSVPKDLKHVSKTEDIQKNFNFSEKQVLMKKSLKGRNGKSNKSDAKVQGMGINSREKVNMEKGNLKGKVFERNKFFSPNRKRNESKLIKQEGCSQLPVKKKSENLKNLKQPENVIKFSENVSKLSENSSKISENFTKKSENSLKISEMSSKISEKFSNISGNIRKISENLKISDVTKISENVKISEDVIKNPENVSKLPENFTKKSEKLAKISENSLKISENVSTNSGNITKISENIKISEDVSKKSEKLTKKSENFIKMSENIEILEDVIKNPENVSKMSENLNRKFENFMISEDATKIPENVNISEDFREDPENVSKMSENLIKKSKNLTEKSENFIKMSENVTEMSKNIKVAKDLAKDPENLTKMSEILTKESENLTKKSKNLAKKSENVIKMSENFTRNSENYINISENVTEDSEDVTKMSENLTKRFQNLTKKSKNLTEKSENFTEKSEHFIKMSENFTKKPENVPKMFDNLTNKSENLTKKSKKLIKKSENFIKNSEDVTQIPENMKISEGVTKEPENVPEMSEHYINISENVTEDPEDVTKMSDNFIKTSENFAKNPENITKIPENVIEMFKFSENCSKKSDNFPKIPENHKKMSKNVSKKSEHYSRIPENFTKVSENIPKISEKFSKLSETFTKIPEKIRSRSVDIKSRTKSAIKTTSDFIPPKSDLIENNPNNYKPKNFLKKVIDLKPSEWKTDEEDVPSINDSLIVHPSIHSGSIDLSEFGFPDNSDNSGEDDDTIAEIQSIEDDTTKNEIELISNEPNLNESNLNESNSNKSKTISINNLNTNTYKSENENVSNILKVEYETDIINIEDVIQNRKSKKVFFSDKVMFMESDKKESNLSESFDDEETKTPTTEIDPEMIELSIKLPDVSFAEDLISQNFDIFDHSKPSTSKGSFLSYEKREVNKRFLETIPIEKLIENTPLNKKMLNVNVSDDSNENTNEDDSEKFEFRKTETFESENFKSIDETISEVTELDTSKYFSPPEIEDRKIEEEIEDRTVDNEKIEEHNHEILSSIEEQLTETFTPLAPIEELSEIENLTTSYEYHDALERDRTICEEDIYDTDTGNETVMFSAYEDDEKSQIYEENMDTIQEERSSELNTESRTKERSYNIYNCLTEPSKVSTSTICTTESISNENSTNRFDEEKIFLTHPKTHLIRNSLGSCNTIESVILSDDRNTEEYVSQIKRIEISEVSSVRTYDSVFDDSRCLTEGMVEIVSLTETCESVQKMFDNTDQFNVYRSDYNLSEGTLNNSQTLQRTKIINDPFLQKIPKGINIASTSSGSVILEDIPSTPKIRRDKYLSDIEEDTEEINKLEDSIEEENSKTLSDDLSVENKFSKGDNTLNNANNENIRCENKSKTKKIDFIVARSEVCSIPIDNKTVTYLSSEDTNELVEMNDLHGCNFVKKVISDTTLDDEDTMNIEDNLSEDEKIEEKVEKVEKVEKIEKIEKVEKNEKIQICENDKEKRNNLESNKELSKDSDSYAHICPQIKLTQHYIDENHTFTEDVNSKQTTDESCGEDLSIDSSSLAFMEKKSKKKKRNDSQSNKKNFKEKSEQDEESQDEVKRTKSKKSFPSISKIGKKAKKDSNCKIT